MKQQICDTIYRKIMQMMTSIDGDWAGLTLGEAYAIVILNFYALCTCT